MVVAVTLSHSTPLTISPSLNALLPELTAPQGRSTVAAVPLVLSGVLMSPDCNWTLAFNATGTRLPVVRRKAIHLAAVVILVRP